MIEAERLALRRRYARERDKRLRPDGNDQYLELKSQFSHLLDDPYTPQAERDPKRDHVTIAFVGGGFAVHVHGFPNVFHVQLWQGANAVANVPHNLTDSAKTAAAVVSHMVDNGFDVVEVTREAEDAWMELLRPNPVMTSFLADCTPGYYNNEGHFDGLQFPLGGGYHKGATAYFRFIDQWRRSGDFAGLKFSRK